MVIISENLRALVDQYKVCKIDLVDEFSLKVKLGNKSYSPIPSQDTVVYGSHPNPATLFNKISSIQQNLTLTPGEKYLACTQDIYTIPSDYFGLVQTKGTLARLFVAITCNDGQVEPGFKGHITLEIINNSPWTVDLPVGSDIGQMYLFKCSMSAEKPYDGRYAEPSLNGPTLPIF